MKTLNKINYTIEDSFYDYDEHAYYNDIDISSRGVEYISHEESLQIINELGYQDYEPQIIYMANLSDREKEMADEMSSLQDYMLTREDKQ